MSYIQPLGARNRFDLQTALEAANQVLALISERGPDADRALVVRLIRHIHRAASVNNALVHRGTRTRFSTDREQAHRLIERLFHHLYAAFRSHSFAFFIHGLVAEVLDPISDSEMVSTFWVDRLEALAAWYESDQAWQQVLPVERP